MSKSSFLMSFCLFSRYAMRTDPRQFKPNLVLGITFFLLFPPLLLSLISYSYMCSALCVCLCVCLCVFCENWVQFIENGPDSLSKILVYFYLFRLLLFVVCRIASLPLCCGEPAEKDSVVPIFVLNLLFLIFF